MSEADGKGLRYNAGKLRYDLLPPDGLAELVRVYTKGAEKYAPRNWERGMAWSKCFASMMRHCWAFWRGEDYDAETGCHHMAMAAWNAMALCVYSLRQIGEDDRKKIEMVTLEHESITGEIDRVVVARPADPTDSEPDPNDHPFPTFDPNDTAAAIARDKW